MTIQHDPPVLFYFAYGSNMSTPRLLNRVVSARAVAVACLPAHALRFHKRGRDGSAKCDAFYTGQDHDELHGVVYRIAAAEKPCLDECEGLGNGYDVKTVTVRGKNGTKLPGLHLLRHPDRCTPASLSLVPGTRSARRNRTRLAGCLYRHHPRYRIHSRPATASARTRTGHLPRLMARPGHNPVRAGMPAALRVSVGMAICTPPHFMIDSNNILQHTVFIYL